MSDDIVERLHKHCVPRLRPDLAAVLREAAAEIEQLRERVEVLEAVLHAIFPDGANIKLAPKANAEEAKP
jgi:hypothetical protein